MASQSSPMNILLITAEDMGLQLGCYGDPYARTPQLDALAAAGLRCTQAYVTQAVCSPGRASILTGLYPHQNGQVALASHAFAMYRDYPTITSLLQGAGYRTGRIGKLHVLPESANPFDWVWNPGDQWSFKHRQVHAAAEAASQFIAAGPEPFFLMANFPDAHLPWVRQDHGLPPNPQSANDIEVPPGVGISSPRLREQVADYYNCLARLDTGIGLLLATLEQAGVADQTLVLFINDHGPQFSRGKGCTYELAIRAPLLLRWPGVSQAGTVRPELCSQLDVLPTILDAVGLPPLAGLPGRSLRPLAANQPAPDWPAYLFAEWHCSHAAPTPGLLNPQRTVRDARYKLHLNLMPDPPNQAEHYYTQQVLVKSGCTQDEIDAAPPAIRQAYAHWRHQGAVELYDLQQDPHEWHDLAQDPAHAATRDHLLAVLRQWQITTRDPLADPALLARFIADHARISATAGSHKIPGFRWPYLDYFPPH